MKFLTAVKIPNTITVTLLPHHDYLMLPGSHIIHPFPLLCTREFIEENIYKIQQIAINLEEAANNILIFNTTPHDQFEDEVK